MILFECLKGGLSLRQKKSELLGWLGHNSMALFLGFKQTTQIKKKKIKKKNLGVYLPRNMFSILLHARKCCNIPERNISERLIGLPHHPTSVSVEEGR